MKSPPILELANRTLARARYRQETRELGIGQATMTIEQYLRRQVMWSKRRFGLGERTLGITRHMEKEIAEVRAKPNVMSEWIDLMILALDGYWRHGGTPERLMDDLIEKQAVNYSRDWVPHLPEHMPVEHAKVNGLGIAIHVNDRVTGSR
jgi:dATP/dGTP pyrophosphohydrolase